ncbi:hypothetical protein PLICRDRAFT_177019 [Plicaturopsis crispa FD-325 SS-3]|nr:hypothetical protein PLICRDRAFT_177019 [Plicaturopsis crispa FD-325 SS-3]
MYFNLTALTARVSRSSADYHRFHSPVHQVPKQYYTVNPQAANERVHRSVMYFKHTATYRFAVRRREPCYLPRTTTASTRPVHNVRGQYYTVNPQAVNEPDFDVST